MPKIGVRQRSGRHQAPNAFRMVARGSGAMLPGGDASAAFRPSPRLGSRPSTPLRTGDDGMTWLTAARPACAAVRDCRLRLSAMHAPVWSAIRWPRRTLAEHPE